MLIFYKEQLNENYKLEKKNKILLLRCFNINFAKKIFSDIFTIRTIYTIFHTENLNTRPAYFRESYV